MSEARRNQAILSAIPDMIFTIDAQGRYLSYTPAEGMKPLVPPELFIGKTVRQIMPAPIAQKTMEAIEAAIRTQHLQVMAYDLWEGDLLRRYEARIVALGPDEVLAIVRDETARSVLAQEMQRRQEVEALESHAEAAMQVKNAYSLTFREFTTLDLIANGLSDKEISAKLGCSRFTVNKHVTNILSKIGARSRTEAAVRAVREGLLGPGS